MKLSYEGIETIINYKIRTERNVYIKSVNHKELNEKMMIAKSLGMDVIQSELSKFDDTPVVKIVDKNTTEYLFTGNIYIDLYDFKKLKNNNIEICKDNIKTYGLLIIDYPGTDKQINWFASYRSISRILDRLSSLLTKNIDEESITNEIITKKNCRIDIYNRSIVIEELSIDEALKFSNGLQQINRVEPFIIVDETYRQKNNEIESNESLGNVKCIVGEKYKKQCYKLVSEGKLIATVIDVLYSDKQMVAFFNSSESLEYSIGGANDGLYDSIIIGKQHKSIRINRFLNKNDLSNIGLRHILFYKQEE